MNESKYNHLFIKTFGVNSDQLNSEFKRVIKEHGDSEEIRIAFYTQAFETIIAQFKREMAKDETSFSTITFCYKSFINYLNEDGLDSSKQQLQLEQFKREAGKYHVNKKSYNLNTKYGRRKWREEGLREYQNLSSSEKLTRNVIGILILIGICVLVYIILGQDGFMKWATR